MAGPNREQAPQLSAVLRSSGRTVPLVLPKWTGRKDPSVPGAIASAELLPVATAAATVESAGSRAAERTLRARARARERV
jgi:hypothetical protein